MKLGFGSSNSLRKVLRNEWWIGNKTHKQIRKYNEETGKSYRAPIEGEPVIVPTNLAATPLIDPCLLYTSPQTRDRVIQQLRFGASIATSE